MCCSVSLWVEDRQICLLYVTDVLMGGGTAVGENVGLISISMVLGNKKYALVVLNRQRVLSESRSS